MARTPNTERRRSGDKERENDRQDQRIDRERDRETDEIVDKLVYVNRVAKTVKGGRRMAFAALVVVGDQRGRVGYGTGKAREVPEAIRKATEKARRDMIRIPLREGRTLHHDVRGIFGAGEVILRTAPAGTGIIAGGTVRKVLEKAGIRDIRSKSLRSNNKINVVKATFEALKQLQTVEDVARTRGIAPENVR